MKNKFFTKALCVVLSLICVFSQGITALAGEYMDVQSVDPFTGEVYYDYVYIPSKTNTPEVTSIGTDYVKITFSAEYYEASDGYEINLYENGVYTPVKVFAGQDDYLQKVKLDGLAQGKAYAVSVRAFNTYNGVNYYSEYSDVVNFCTAPKAVTLTKATYNSQGKITVKWKKRKNVDGYILQYSTSKKFPDSGKTVTVTVRGEKTLKKVISGLAAKTYYVRLCPYKQLDGVRYCGVWSNTRSVKVKQGMSVKQMLNAVKTNNNGRDTIKRLTKNKVDIAKYKTTYEKVKAIYSWHAKNYNKFAHCLACNSNFNACLSALYDNKQYAPDIWIAAGEVKNSDGSQVIHKWSVLYLAGVEYIFDPRLQGYTGDYTGELYFGVSKGSRISKMYVFEEWYSHWDIMSTNVYCK